jgi:hypothetical protein
MALADAKPHNSPRFGKVERAPPVNAKSAHVAHTNPDAMSGMPYGLQSMLKVRVGSHDRFPISARAFLPLP